MWVESVLGAGAIYPLALMYQMINECFDKSPPKNEEATAIEK